MKLKELYRSDRYYAVGIDEDTGQPVIEVVTTGSAWRTYYFKLTADEFAEFQADRTALDDLADRMAQDKGKKFYADRQLSAQ